MPLFDDQVVIASDVPYNGNKVTTLGGVEFSPSSSPMGAHSLQCKADTSFVYKHPSGEVTIVDATGHLQEGSAPLVVEFSSLATISITHNKGRRVHADVYVDGVLSDVDWSAVVGFEDSKIEVRFDSAQTGYVIVF